VLSDENGEVVSNVTVLSAGVIAISAVLVPASYSSPKSVQTTLLGTSSALDVSLLPSTVWVAQGATLDLPIKARVLSNGKPVAGTTLGFHIFTGSGTLSSSAAVSNNDGFATTVLHITALGSEIQLSVCAEPGDKPCQTFSIFAVPATVFQLTPVSGSQQAIAASQSFRPVSVRVTDSSNPANPIIGANVVFRTVIVRSVTDPPPVSVGGIIINRKPPPVILFSSKASALSTVDGLATLQPSMGGFSGPLTIQGTATAGTETLSFELRSFELRSFGSVTSSLAPKPVTLSDFVKKRRSVSFSNLRTNTPISLSRQ
jgi:hypothetical protein